MSIFNKPRRYPRIFQPYYESFDFYHGRQKWEKSIDKAPREAILLFSIHWLHLEVVNGGFWQYFFNSTSTTCPEAIEGFQAIGMPDVSELVESASLKLGTPFPFDKEQRMRIVGESQSRMNFDEFDDRFYDLADTDQFFRKEPRFVPFADAYADRFG